MTDPQTPAVDAEREGQTYQPPQPFLREHKRAPMVSRDGLQAWLGDEIAYLESIHRTEHGNGALAALKSVAVETADIPDHTTLTARAERAEAELSRLRAENAGLREVIRRGQGAVSAAYSQALAEHQGHDTISDRHDRVVVAWRAEARAALSSEQAAAGERG